MFRRLRLPAAAGLLASAVAVIPPAPASAANSPTLRDCSLLVEGVDPDFVQISGVTVSPQGALTVPVAQRSVELIASESSDPGDQSQQVTFSVTLASAKLPSRTLSGAGTGRVVLDAPLAGSGRGRTYTIGWAAVFDNGEHPCPGSDTPDNPGPSPFLVSVG
jgi:hypothetical protein